MKENLFGADDMKHSMNYGSLEKEKFSPYSGNIRSKDSVIAMIQSHIRNIGNDPKCMNPTISVSECV